MMVLETLLLCPDLPDQASLHSQPASASTPQQSLTVVSRCMEKELRPQRRGEKGDGIASFSCLYALRRNMLYLAAALNQRGFKQSLLQRLCVMLGQTRASDSPRVFYC